MPREEAEFALRYYNSNTCWIDLDKLLAAFGLTRADLADDAEGHRRRPRAGGHACRPTSRSRT